MSDVKKNIFNDPNIRVAVSDPDLADRIKVRLPNNSDPVYWYIKFNTALDPYTVSHKSMKVTEENGYILDTEITYDVNKNFIVIKPTDPYEEGIYYILTITKKVRSKSGNRLRRDIYILFKIKDRRIDEYKVLPPDAIIPKPRKKPEKLKKLTVQRAYTPEIARKIEKTARAPRPSLPYGPMGINVVLAAISIPIVLAGIFMGVPGWVYGGALVLLAGIIHVSFQMGNKRKRSSLIYNTGVMLFNAGVYKSAAKRLNKSAQLDPYNELAEYAAGKVKYYC
jgi:hypothetical protein